MDLAVFCHKPAIANSISAILAILAIRSGSYQGPGFSRAMKQSRRTANPAASYQGPGFSRAVKGF
jgi:hypothetical protein